MKRYNINRDKQIFFIVGIAALCAAAATSVSAATLKGNVRYAGARVEKKTVPVTIDQYLCGKEKEAGDLLLSSTSGIRNVVVSLHGVPAGSKATGQWRACENGSETMRIRTPRGRRTGRRNCGIPQ